MYVVTYYKDTQLSRESFLLSCIIWEKTWENWVLYVTNDLYLDLTSYDNSNTVPVLILAQPNFSGNRWKYRVCTYEHNYSSFLSNILVYLWISALMSGPIIYRIWNEFHFTRYLWNELCVLYPRAHGEGI